VLLEQEDEIDLNDYGITYLQAMYIVMGVSAARQCAWMG